MAEHSWIPESRLEFVALVARRLLLRIECQVSRGWSDPGTSRARRQAAVGAGLTPAPAPVKQSEAQAVSASPVPSLRCLKRLECKTRLSLC